MEMTYVKVYQDWTEATSKLKDGEKGRLIDAMVVYAATGKDVSDTLTGNEQYLFPMFRAQIDRDRQALALYSQKQSENGSKGGRPRKNPKNPPLSDENPKNPPLSGESQNTQKSQDNNNNNNNEVPPLTPPQGDGAGGGARYIDEHIPGMTPAHWEELRSFMDDGLTIDLIQHAVDEAAAQGKRTWAYVRGILNRYLTEGITTVEQAKGGDKPQQPKKTRVEKYWTVVNGEFVEAERVVEV